MTKHQISNPPFHKQQKVTPNYPSYLFAQIDPTTGRTLACLVVLDAGSVSIVFARDGRVARLCIIRCQVVLFSVYFDRKRDRC